MLEKKTLKHIIKKKLFFNCCTFVVSLESAQALILLQTHFSKYLSNSIQYNYNTKENKHAYYLALLKLRKYVATDIRLSKADSGTLPHLRWDTLKQ